VNTVLEAMIGEKESEERESVEIQKRKQRRKPTKITKVLQETTACFRATTESESNTSVSFCSFPSTDSFTRSLAFETTQW
jgi:hypothetical protein